MTTIREIPSGLWAEIVNQADLELAAADTQMLDNNSDTTRVSYWLTHRRRPSTVEPLDLGHPSAEPGDFLVKVAGAEAWMFTVRGWQPLAPAAAVPETDEPGEGGVVFGGFTDSSKAARQEPEGAGAEQRQAHEEREGGPIWHARRSARGRRVEFDPGIVGGKQSAPGPWGKSTVEAIDDVHHWPPRRPAPFLSDRFVDEFLREGGGQGEVDARRSFDAISELHTNADVLERVASVLAGDHDGGNDSPFYESIASARTFARALRYAASTIHKHTIR